MGCHNGIIEPRKKTQQRVSFSEELSGKGATIPSESTRENNKSYITSHSYPTTRQKGSSSVPSHSSSFLSQLFFLTQVVSVISLTVPHPATNSATTSSSRNVLKFEHHEPSSKRKDNSTQLISHNNPYYNQDANLKMKPFLDPQIPGSSINDDGFNVKSSRGSSSYFSHHSQPGAVLTADKRESRSIFSSGTTKDRRLSRSAPWDSPISGLQGSKHYHLDYKCPVYPNVSYFSKSSLTYHESFIIFHGMKYQNKELLDKNSSISCN
jgi:hypothetical protein